MGYRLGVDLGTTRTSAAIDDGRGAAVMDLAPQAPTVPSVAFLSPDGTLLFGEDADRLAATDPARGARAFKRRVGDADPVVLAGRSFSPQELFAGFLAWTVSVAAQRQGAAPDELVVPYPASWSGHRRELLEHEVARAALPPVIACTAPEAAAAQHDAVAPLQPGDRIAVHDLGGGTFDVCVLEKQDLGFAVLGSPDGLERFGGIDLDEAVLQHVLARLPDGAAGQDPDDPQVAAHLEQLRARCATAKEALSTEVETSIPVTLPGLDTTVRLTRTELDGLLDSPLRATVEATQRALQSAQVGATDLVTVLLVGGSSRIPLVGQLLQSELGLQTTTSGHPQLDIGVVPADKLNRRCGLAQLFDELGQVIDRHGRSWIADVKRLAARLGDTERKQRGVDDVVDITPGADLGAVVVDMQWLAFERPNDEVVHGSFADLPGSVDVKRTDADRRKAELTVIGHRQVFGRQLRHRVGPAGFANCADGGGI